MEENLSPQKRCYRLLSEKGSFESENLGADGPDIGRGLGLELGFALREKERANERGTRRQSR